MVDSVEIPVEKIVDGEVVVIDTKTIPIITKSESTSMIPHQSGAERKRVNVMLDGKKIGTGTITADGTLSILLTDTKVAELINQKRDIQHLSIDPTFKS